MSTICKNCETEFEGNFCIQCGQKSSVKKLNWKFLWHDIQHGLLHFDNGIFFTIKELTLRPGNTIREFTEGKRVKHFKPFSFVVLMATIYAFLFHTFHIAKAIEETSGQAFKSKKTSFNPMSFVEWTGNHYALSTLILLPFVSICSYLAFKKAKFNFVEHLVLNTYLSGQAILFKILLFPLFFVPFFKSNYLLTDFFSGLLTFIYTAWGFFQFFNMIKPEYRILRILLYYLNIFLIYLASIIIITLIIFTITLLTKK